MIAVALLPLPRKAEQSLIANQVTVASTFSDSIVERDGLGNTEDSPVTFHQAPLYTPDDLYDEVNNHIL